MSRWLKLKCEGKVFMTISLVLGFPICCENTEFLQGIVVPYILSCEKVG